MEKPNELTKEKLYVEKGYKKEVTRQYYRFGKWNDITEENYYFAFNSDNGHKIRVKP